MPNPLVPFVDSGDFHLEYRPDLGIGIGRWLNVGEDARLRGHYALVRELAAQRDCQRWLLDARRRTPSGELLANWVLTDFFPALAAAVSARFRVAYLISPHRLGAMASTVAEFQDRMYSPHGEVLITITEKAAHEFLYV